MEKTNKTITDHQQHHHHHNITNNWLGFSLSSPHFNNSNNNMEVSSEPSHSRSSVTAFLHSPPPPHPHPHFNFPPICYGENDGNTFCPPLTVMPLKSDGSLYLMDDFSTTQSHQGMGTTSTPTMGLHHHHHHHEPIALSLDMSMYYNHNHQTHQTDHESNAQDCFNHSLDKINETHITDCNNIHLQNWVSLRTNNGGSDQMMLQNAGGAGGGGQSMGYGHDFQSLSLSMSPGSQSSCVTGGGSQMFTSPTVNHQCLDIVEPSKKRGAEKVDNQKQIVHRKSLDTFGQRTSQYRGVTRHRWTGRYEAHLWDNSCKKEGQSRKGRQVYLGGYDMEEKAARAYDLAALKYWGPATHINFALENYEKELEEMKNMTRQEYVAHLRRKSSGFSRGASIYRGVTRHHQHGRWQARIGRVAGNKDLYLGTFSTQEEAAEAYDVAAIKFRGVSAVTNFDISKYDVERIMASNTLLAGELARRNKEVVVVVDPPVNLRQRANEESDLKMIICQSSGSGNGKGSRGEEEEEGVVSNMEKEQDELQNGSTYCFSLMRPPPLTSLPHGPLFAAWANAS
ncbi:AP2-like ethylene-responsive transcription factor ANT [Impatiens glandulifera]|uniref:AP2-like ethylene-responsive transcription factor ANT n=1 Tax=Impatiens glandulifera TaxID=253017 RepID=UPI001FB12A77|nr:AP2-like ethylene-responsive transcription factor ANT [Impatiens glandulifera]